MKSENYERNIDLVCPTCGGTQFETDDDIEAEYTIFRCVSCDRKMTKDEIIQENLENVNEHISEIGKEDLNDAAKEFRNNLKRALRGNKNIRVE
jgi:hypothetical protein